MGYIIGLAEYECEEIDGGSILFGVARAMLGFLAAAVICPIKIAISENDSGTVQIFETCVVGGAWVGEGFLTL